MNGRPLSIVVLGLSLSSSWGNGHATTYRALLAGLAAFGHRILFLERETPWYAANRDLREPDFCRLSFYGSVAELDREYGSNIADADAIVIGSYVPDGVEVARICLSHARGVVAFYDIDTPVTLRKMERGERDYLAPEIIPSFDVYLSFTGGPTLRRLEVELGARRACTLYCAVDASRYRPTGEPASIDLGFLGTYSPDRQPALERLLIEPARRLPNRRFLVAGPQFPDSIDWPPNITRIEHLGPEEHPSFYSRLRFALNVTRADMVASGWSPSVRLFEAAACRTPVISDPWEGLSTLFPEDDAVIVARDTNDVVSVLTEMPEERRVRIASVAQRIVLRNHTGVARACELQRIIQDLLPQVRRRRTAKATLLQLSI